MAERKATIMELETVREGGVLVAEAWNRVDGTNAHLFEQALREAIGTEDQGMVIDFGGLSYISSAGLRAILVTAKTLKKQGAALAICGLQAPIREVFEISGFDKIIPIYDARSGAVASVSS